MEQVMWRDVTGFEGRYQVSNTGEVRSLDVAVRCRSGKTKVHRGRTVSVRVNNRGYETVGLCVDRKQMTKLVHRLVAEAFVSNPENKSQVNHKDEDIRNNHADNLEWVTDNENKAYSAITEGGTQRPMRPVVVVDMSNGASRVFEGLRMAERAMAIDHRAALNVIQGKQRHTHGYWIAYIGGDAECRR